MEDAAARIALSWDADRRAAGWIDKPFIERFLSVLPPGATVLDLGCGGGSPVALHMVAARHRRGQLPDAHLAMPNQDAGSGVDRRRHALFGPRRRFGDILAWDSFFHLGHKDQGRCLAFLPCTPRQALF